MTVKNLKDVQVKQDVGWIFLNFESNNRDAIGQKQATKK